MKMKMLFASLFFSARAFAFFHVTPPRHVTVSTRLGRVLEGHDESGFALKTPLTSSYDMLVEEQVDTVRDAQCGTKDGITLVFPEIEVHNLLPMHKAREMFVRFGPDYDQLTIFANVKFMVGQICGELTAEEVYLTEYNGLDEQLQGLLSEYQAEKDTGIVISKVKFYKPFARSSDILQKFQRRAEGEAERQALLAEADRIEQANRNALSVADGRNRVAVSAKEADERKHTIQLAMDRRAAESAADVALIEAKARAAGTLIEAEAGADATKLEAESNSWLLTEEYLLLKQTEVFRDKTKLIFGNQIPKLMLVDPERLGRAS